MISKILLLDCYTKNEIRLQKKTTPGWRSNDAGAEYSSATGAGAARPRPSARHFTPRTAASVCSPCFARFSSFPPLVDVVGRLGGGLGGLARRGEDWRRAVRLASMTETERREERTR